MKLQGLEAEAVWDTMPTGRLLVVDNDAFLRATLMEQFAAEGFDEVYEAETLIETFREIDLRNPDLIILCLLYTSPSPRDLSTSRMPSSA